MGTRTQPSPLDAAVWAQIQGEVSGQVAVGSYILQIGSVHGGVVSLAPQGPRSPQPRPCPVVLRPRAFPGLLDRRTEVATATDVLQTGQPAEFHGEEGAGKSSLLRAVAYHPATAAFRDGVVYLRVGDRPVADLLESLFDAFYDRDAALKPTDAQLRHALTDKQALILCDDVELARDEVDAVMDAAPGCTFLLASPGRRLWGQGRSVALAGLPPDEALALLSRALDRTLTEEERVAAGALSAAVGGNPLRLLQAAALARETGRPLAELATRLGAAKPPAVFVDEVLPALPESQRRILAVLSALGGVPVDAAHLAAIAEVADPDPALEALERRHLVSRASPYRATGTAGASWLGLDLDDVRARAVAHFTAWAASNARSPARVASDADALVWLLRWADEAGWWHEVVRLGRAIDAALAVAGRWGAWERALASVRRAARGLGDRAGEAWALHQLGTRALCLGHVVTARAELTEALRLREALGDRVGAAVTRHNLGFLLPPPGGPPAHDPPLTPAPPATFERSTRRLTPWAKIAAAIAVVVVLAGSGLYALGGDRNDNPVGTPTRTRTPTPHLTRTPKPRPTRTPTESPPTRTPTADGSTGRSGGNGQQNPQPPLTANGSTATPTDTPDIPANVAVTLDVGQPALLADGRIDVPFTLSSASDGDVGPYEINVEALDGDRNTIGQSPVGGGSIVLGSEWQGAVIMLRAAVDACLDQKVNPGDCPVKDRNPEDDVAESPAVELPLPADLIPLSCTSDVEVKNQGKGPAGPTITRMVFSDHDPVERETGLLQPGESAYLNFGPLPKGVLSFSIVVDADGTLAESDEGNNELNCNEPE
jgi:CARDB